MKPAIEMRLRKVIGGAVVCGGLVAAVGLGSGVANAAPAPAQISTARLAAFDAPVPLYGPGFIGPRPHFGGYGRGFYGGGFRGGYGRGFDRGGYGRGFGRGFGRGRYY